MVTTHTPIVCPTCGSVDLDRGNIREHTGTDGRFWSYQILCRHCDQVLAAGITDTDPKDRWNPLDSTERHEIREKKTKTRADQNLPLFDRVEEARTVPRRFGEPGGYNPTITERRTTKGKRR